MPTPLPPSHPLSCPLHQSILHKGGCEDGSGWHQTFSKLISTINILSFHWAPQPMWPQWNYDLKTCSIHHMDVIMAWILSMLTCTFVIPEPESFIENLPNKVLRLGLRSRRNIQSVRLLILVTYYYFRRVSRLWIKTSLPEDQLPDSMAVRALHQAIMITLPAPSWSRTLEMRPHNT